MKNETIFSEAAMVAAPEHKLAVIGLGYVGLPLALAFGAVRPVVGFDVDKLRVAELTAGIDRTNETSPAEISDATFLRYTSELRDLDECTCFIVAVPTPIDRHKQPDFNPLILATRSIAPILRPGGLVIYESTVYPGATEEICVPVLEELSGLTYNVDFFVGYSPERINPGDKNHRLRNITKVTAGSTAAVADVVDQIYRQIITA